MNHAVHNKIVSFIWSIADDCLRDVYVRGKYRDVILPMVVLRRLDTLLEPTKEKVLEEVAFQQNDMGLVELDGNGLQDAAGMLTESQKFIKDENGAIRATGDVYLYGKEINDETYAICKSDMMIKGNNPSGF